MKSTNYSRDENGSTVGLIALLIILVIIIAIGYWIIANVQNGSLSDFFGDLGVEAGSGIWGFLTGATSAFFGGAWKTGTNLGASTQKYNIFSNASKIWKHYFP